jgi:hypothetical protein
MLCLVKILEKYRMIPLKLFFHKIINYFGENGNKYMTQITYHSEKGMND